jgi:transposase-like protein
VALPLPSPRPVRPGHRRVPLSAARCAQCQKVFTKALASAQTKPTEVVTDGYRLYPALLGKFVPQAFHDVERYANNAIEADHGRLKARLRPMRGLKQFRSARVIVAGHAFVQNLRRGHYELGVEASANLRVAEAFAELALVV